MNTLTLDDLSSCESSENYYVDVLYQESEKHDVNLITTLTLNVDRGVNFIFLKNVLAEFPNLKEVHLEQNYTTGNNTFLNEFVEFASTLKLAKLTLIDTQSVFLEELYHSNCFKFSNNIDTFFTLLPDGEYNINYGSGDRKYPEKLVRLYTNKSLTYAVV